MRMVTMVGGMVDRCFILQKTNLSEKCTRMELSEFLASHASHEQ
jgi:hypothetical protein